MSFLVKRVNYKNRDFLLKVGSLNLSSKREILAPLDEIHGNVEVEVDSDQIQSLFFQKIKKSEVILDLGGSGDCFLLCVNEALSMRGWGPIYSIDSLYQYLHLPINTYIEDSHISQIVKIYKVTIYVTVRKDELFQINKFGDYSRFICIHNEVPHHYLLYKNLFEGEIDYAVNNQEQSRLLDWSEEVEEKEQQLDPMTEMESYQDAPQVIYWNAYDNYKEEVTIVDLYQYCASRYELVKKNKALKPSDSEIYYKLRHNYFKTIFLDALNLPSTEERPFTDFGVDSPKTPDFLAKFDFGWLLIEFTVVKKFATSLRTKLSKSKYDNEGLDLQLKSGAKVFSYYPTLGLDEVNSGVNFDIKEISRLMGVEITFETESVFNNMIEELNVLEFNISEIMPDLLLNDARETEVNLKPKMVLPGSLFSKILEQTGAKKQRNQYVMALIRKNISRLDRSLKYSPYKAKYKIFVNVKSNRIFVDMDRTGVSRNTLQTMLQNLSMNCLDYVEYLGNETQEENPFLTYGEPKIKGLDTHSVKNDVDFDTDNYERLYFRKLMKEIKSPNRPETLADNVLNEQIDQVKGKYETLLEEKRKDSRVVVNNKNHFVFPFANEATKGEFKQLKIESKNPITSYILRKVTDVTKVEQTVDRNPNLTAMDDIMNNQNKAYKSLVNALQGDVKLARLLKQATRESKWEDITVRHGVIWNDEIRTSLLEFHSMKKKLSAEIGEPTRRAYRNRITISNSMYRRDWPAEMQHFSEKKGIVKIAEARDMTMVEREFESIISKIWSVRTDPVRDDIYSATEPLGKDLSKCLTEIMEDIKEPKEELMRTQLMYDLELVSRLCYSLLYFSNIKLNKEDFMYDNLGYEDVLLIVKGGKKILSTKSSRLFKLCFPVDSNFAKVYQSEHTEKILLGEKLYIILPWQIFRFPMIKKGIELYYSFSNYYLSSYIESGLTVDQFQKFVTTKVLNMYSQRRKVEIWFGYFRYLYLNSMSTHTSVLDLVEDMIEFDYDPYMYYCQRMFLNGYKNIKSNAEELRVYDIFTKTTFANFDLCAEKFDEALFMTQAAFDRTNEHMKNLRSVLEVQNEFNSKYSMDPLKQLEQTSVDASEDDYFQQLFSDDFKFDPKLTQMVGTYAGKYIRRAVNISDMRQEFSMIMNDSYTKISTSKGLRSSRGPFWGEKGHDVLFSNQSTLNLVKHFIDELPKDNSEFRKRMDLDHRSFKEIIESLSEIQLEFDVKDKAQWKGSREIYVMTEDTKVLQQPLERFFKFLCKWAPNELIHKASHVRPKFIHSQVYEYSSSEEEKTFCTLDCRKWAPKSNLWKYYYFILGMSPYLPEEFVNYFMAVWSLMFKKKIRIQSRYVEKLQGNEATKHLAELLDKRSDGDYEMTMPYSFMMGIFNYLSSLLHAFSQLYFNDKIALKQSASLSLIAHSDDSGGVILSKSYSKNIQIYCQYELFQKGLNHMMSKKKCALSKIFFEMISIMYANKRLVPMTHKFLANTSFEPKGKGWVDDISNVVSKVVEIFSNGGTLRQCYLTMLSLGEMTRKAYHLPRFNNLSHIPLAFGGIFNMHPIHLILLGADAQEIMLDVVENTSQRDFRIKTYLNLCGDYYPGKGTSVKYQIPYYKKHNMAYEFKDEDMSKLKLISSCLPGTTVGDAMAHYSRLKDNAYVYSLEGVDMCQIYTMTMFTKTMVMHVDEKKRLDMRKFCKLYSIMNALHLGTERTEMRYSNFHHYMKAAESMKFSMSDITVESQKTCKPVTYSTFQNVGLGLTFKTINEIIAYNSDENLGFLFPDKKKMDVMTKWVRSTIKASDEYDVNDFLQKLSSKDLQKVRSAYCFIPSGLSLDTVERFWTYSLFYCTKRYYISSKKPQYFTIDQFKLWNEDYESLKYYYLILKVMLKTKSLNSQDIQLIKQNVKSNGGSHADSASNMVDEIIKLKRAPQFTRQDTNLPFIVYHEAQRRSTNVWHGSADFTLYTMFGSVHQYKRDGDLYYQFEIASEEFLDQIYFLFKNSIITRGIMEPSVEYNLNDSSDYVVGFTDLRQPCALHPGSRGMMIKNSKVVMVSVPNNFIVRDGTEFEFEGNRVDFEIYQNYDINKPFFEKYNLGTIKHLILEPELKLSPDIVLRNLLSTKLYKTVFDDPSHAMMGTMEEKYQNSGLLGSERSLTRSLALSDMKGKTNYTSSINPKKASVSLLEGQSYKDIPVLDMMENCSFSRLSYKEKMTLNKIADERQLNEKDEFILSAIVKKLGAKPTMSAITSFKIIVASLSYEDVVKIGVTPVNEFIEVLVSSALKCIADRPKKRSKYQAKGTLAEISCNLYCMLSSTLNLKGTASFLLGLFLRAHYDNPSLFWDLRKRNIYAALYQPGEKDVGTQAKFILACISRFEKDTIQKILSSRSTLLAARYYKVHGGQLDRILKNQRKWDLEYLSAKLDTSDLTLRNYFISEDELDDDQFDESMDAVSGGDDPEFFSQRTWDEDCDEGTFYLMNKKDYAVIAEETIKKDFSFVRILSIFDIPDFPWLGDVDISLQTKFGLKFNVAEYPGKGSLPRTVWMQKAKVIPRFEAKPLTFKKSDEKSTRKPFDSLMFEKGTDEEIDKYQDQLLHNIGVANVEPYKKYYYRRNDSKRGKALTLEDIVKSIDETLLKKVVNFKGLPIRRSSEMPGYTGSLRDVTLNSELNALFSSDTKTHSESLTAGNQRISKSSYKAIVRRFKRLYQLADESSKALIVIALSTMRDAICEGDSDGWYVDSLNEFINHIEDKLSPEETNISMVIPKPLESKIEYEISYVYDED